LEIIVLVQSEGKELDESKNTLTPLNVTQSSVRRTRILIVEDERHIARLLEFVLRKADYEVFVCHSAEEAIPKLDECHPDAMVLDLVLPGMTGLEFLRIIRAAPYVCSCAVVVLSSRWLEGTTAALQEAGAAAQCSKPIAPSSLLRKLRELGIHHSIVVEAT
jgi:DNA-binding response OmpR family regulator